MPSFHRAAVAAASLVCFVGGSCPKLLSGEEAETAVLKLPSDRKLVRVRKLVVNHPKNMHVRARKTGRTLRINIHETNARHAEQHHHHYHYWLPADRKSRAKRRRSHSEQKIGTNRAGKATADSHISLSKGAAVPPPSPHSDESQKTQEKKGSAPQTKPEKAGVLCVRIQSPRRDTNGRSELENCQAEEKGDPPEPVCRGKSEGHPFPDAAAIGSGHSDTFKHLFPVKSGLPNSRGKGYIEGEGGVTPFSGAPLSARSLVAVEAHGEAAAVRKAPASKTDECQLCSGCCRCYPLSSSKKETAKQQSTKPSHVTPGAPRKNHEPLVSPNPKGCGIQSYGFAFVLLLLVGVLTFALCKHKDRQLAELRKKRHDKHRHDRHHKPSPRRQQTEQLAAVPRNPQPLELPGDITRNETDSALARYGTLKHDPPLTDGAEADTEWDDENKLHASIIRGEGEEEKEEVEEEDKENKHVEEEEEGTEEQGPFEDDVPEHPMQLRRGNMTRFPPPKRLPSGVAVEKNDAIHSPLLSDMREIVRSRV